MKSKNKKFEYLKKDILEWTEVNGKKYPKRVVYLVSKLPNHNKGNGETIDNILLEDGDIQLDRKE